MMPMPQSKDRTWDQTRDHRKPPGPQITEKRTDETLHVSCDPGSYPKLHWPIPSSIHSNFTTRHIPWDTNRSRSELIGEWAIAIPIAIPIPILNFAPLACRQSCRGNNIACYRKPNKKTTERLCPVILHIQS